MQSDQGCYGIPRRSNPPRSSILVYGPTGHGSVGTKVRTFGNLLVNPGNPSSTAVPVSAGQSYDVTPSIRYVSDTSGGDYFVVKEPGVYFVVYCDSKGTSGGTVAVIANEPSSSLTAAASSSANNLRIAYFEIGTGVRNSCSGTAILGAGDIVRARDEGNNDTTSNLAYFSITKISN